MLERVLLLPVACSALACGSAVLWPGDPSGEAAPAAAVRSQPATRENLHIKASNDGLFRVSAHLDGQPVKAVFDTGASRTVIGSGTLGRLTRRGGHSADQATRGGTMLTFSGRVPYRLVRIASVRIGTREIGPLEVAVIDDAHAPDVIGQDVIARLGDVSIRGRELIIE